jgi:hypothetical protein
MLVEHPTFEKRYRIGDLAHLWGFGREAISSTRSLRFWSELALCVPDVALPQQHGPIRRGTHAGNPLPPCKDAPVT